MFLDDVSVNAVEAVPAPGRTPTLRHRSRGMAQEAEACRLIPLAGYLGTSGSSSPYVVCDKASSVSARRLMRSQWAASLNI